MNRLNIFKRSSQEADCSDRYADDKRRRGPWTPEEDDALLALVGELRPSDEIDWFACKIPTRTTKQCQHRYRLRHDPSVKRGPWTPQEDELLLQLHKEHGRVWVRISGYIEGRPEWSCKSRFHSLRRLRMKEWSEEEDELIRRWIADGSDAEALREAMMPERTVHAVQKRWDLVYIRDLGKQIKTDIRNQINHQQSGGSPSTTTTTTTGVDDVSPPSRRAPSPPPARTWGFSRGSSHSEATTTPSTPGSTHTTDSVTVVSRGKGNDMFSPPIDLKHASWASAKSSPSRRASKRRSVESIVRPDELFVVAEELDNQEDEYAILGPSADLFSELSQPPTRRADSGSPNRAPRLKKHASSMTMMLQVLNEECL